MIIAVTHQKGGAGKTTVSLSLSCELKSRGYSVLTVDADPQRTLDKWREAAVENKTTDHLPEVFVPESDDLTRLHEHTKLKRKARKFDVTIIDCPPALGTVTRSALMMSQLVIIPCPPSKFEVEALDETFELIATAMQINEELSPWLAITNRIVNSKGADQWERTLRTKAEEVGCPIFKNLLASRVAVKDAANLGQYVGVYQPSGKAAKELKKLVDELLEEIG